MPAPTRLIARLDVKGSQLIKGVHLEGLRVIGDPAEHARRYYAQGADEILYMDLVASLYGRSQLSEIVRQTAQDVFVPLTVGGGVRSLQDVDELLRAGADKVAINTAAVARPALLSEVAQRYGSQCMVLSIEAQGTGPWEVLTDCGRERSGKDVVSWARQAVELGAGEILLTSIPKEGTRQGFDVELVRAITQAVAVPVIASGGYGEPAHLHEVVQHGGANAVAIADALHYQRSTLQDIRQSALATGLKLRIL